MLKYTYKESNNPELFDFNLNDPIFLSETQVNEYKRVWFEIEVPEGEVGDIGLLFYDDNPDLDQIKKINCLYVEKLEQQVGFEETEE